MNFEFRKGLLFIRLSGKLNRMTFKSLNTTIDYFLFKQGIRYFVLNLNELNSISKYGMEVLEKKRYEMFKSNRRLIICLDNDQLLWKYEKIDNELNAFEIIKV